MAPKQDWWKDFDDERIILSDGVLNVEDALHGVEKVAGSRSCVRDPRLARFADMPVLWIAPTQMAQLAPGTKWCCSCGDVRPKSYFSPDKRAYDGLDARCKACENERRRKRYADAVGHEARPYRRQEATA